MKWSYRPVYRHVVLPAHCVLRRRSTLRWYDKVIRQQHLSAGALAALQREKLAALVDHCQRNVPFYRDRFRRAGVRAGDVKDLADLRQAGIRIGKDDIRSAGDALLADGSDKSRLYSVCTGGSTGIPLRFYRSMDTVCRRQALKFRAESWIGKPIGTRTSLIWGRVPPRQLYIRAAKFVYWWYQNYQFLSAFDMAPDQLVAYRDRIARFGPEFIESYVTAVHQLARVMATRKLAPPPGLRGILVGAEQLVESQRQEIEASFGCPVYNRYGSSEFTNIASECGHRQGLHINSDHILVEVVNDRDEPVIDQVGEIVVTDLDAFDMPLIRYRIGDRGILSSGQCSCGLPFPLLKSINGRVSQRLVTPTGREIHDIFFIHTLTKLPGVARFQVVQKSLDMLQVNLETDRGANRAETAVQTRARLESLGGQGMQVTINFVDTIPLTNAGKLRHFISELPQPAGEGR